MKNIKILSFCLLTAAIGFYCGQNNRQNAIEKRAEEQPVKKSYSNADLEKIIFGSVQGCECEKCISQ
jgi:hypothetical protein